MVCEKPEDGVLEGMRLVKKDIRVSTDVRLSNIFSNIFSNNESCTSELSNKRTTKDVSNGRCSITLCILIKDFIIIPDLCCYYNKLIFCCSLYN